MFSAVARSHSLRRFYNLTNKKNGATGYAFTIGSAEEPSHSMIHFTLGSTEDISGQGRPEFLSPQVQRNNQTGSDDLSTASQSTSKESGEVGEQISSAHNESSRNHPDNELITGIGAFTLPEHLLEPDTNRGTRNRGADSGFPNPISNLDEVRIIVQLMSDLRIAFIIMLNGGIHFVD